MRNGIMRLAQRAFWIVFQTFFTVEGFMAGWNGTLIKGWSRPACLILETATGFFMGLALTVAWVLLYELFRFTLPRLLCSGVQKIRAGHVSRLRAGRPHVSDLRKDLSGIGPGESGG